jgi:hypothetical protein
LLGAGAAELAGAAESAGAAEDALLGELAGGVLSPPHATIAPAAAMTARTATIAIFFMWSFSSSSRGACAYGAALCQSPT